MCRIVTMFCWGENHERHHVVGFEILRTDTQVSKQMNSEQRNASHCDKLIIIFIDFTLPM